MTGYTLLAAALTLGGYAWPLVEATPVPPSCPDCHHAVDSDEHGYLCEGEAA